MTEGEGAHPTRILLVDDEPDDRALARREAEGAFPDAILAEAGTREEFEAALVAPAPDLVVTDLALKWGTGREVLARVREVFPNCPVIMFTDSGDEMTAVDLMKAGLDDYVVKSARQLPRLRASIRIALEGGRSRRTLSLRERQLASALEHQRTIVRELHHRVKNNLQAITSLLTLRGRRRGGEVAAELEDLAGRMQALGLVQARIYETEALDRVDFAAVLEDVSGSLVRSHSDGLVTLDRRGKGSLNLDVARAMPLGLLMYEVILNALKHAWPDGRRGRLLVELRTQANISEILIADDGVGFQKDDVVRGLGLGLARALAAEAQVAIETISRPNEGTSVTLRLL